MQVFYLNKLLETATCHKEDVVSWCDVCGEEIRQDMNKCPGCGDDIVWKSSKEWKLKHGSPTTTIRKLRSVSPDNQPGEYLMSKTGLPGFKSQSEADRFNDAVEKVGVNKANKIIKYCWGTGSRKRGLVQHVINALEMQVRKQAQPEEKGVSYEF